MKLRLACLGAAIIAALALPAWSADDLRTAEMVDNARQWSQKGRDDLAAEIWRKVLIVVPEHPEALVSLGLIEARAGRMPDAQALLARARRVPASPARLKVLAAAIDGSHAAAQDRPVAAAPVEAPKPAAPFASAAAARPRPDKPAASANDWPVTRPSNSGPVEPGRGRAPPAALPAPATAALPPAASRSAEAEAGPALRLRGEAILRPAEARGDAARDELGELRSAAATSNERWPQTRLRLEQLARSSPGDQRFLLALAVHLSLREPTRREALRQFQALGQQEPGNQEVPTAWRRALLALSPRAGDEFLFTAYLARQPNDAAVMERLNTLRGSTGAASRR